MDGSASPEEWKILAGRGELGAALSEWKESHFESLQKAHGKVAYPVCPTCLRGGSSGSMEQGECLGLQSLPGGLPEDFDAVEGRLARWVYLSNPGKALEGSERD